MYSIQKQLDKKDKELKQQKKSLKQKAKIEN